jgi:hypothetical protein
MLACNWVMTCTSTRNNVSNSNCKKMWGLCSTWTDMKNVYKILVGVLGRAFFRNLGLGVRIILKRIVKRWVVMLWTRFTWLETGSSGRLLWRRYLLALQKAKNFFDQPSQSDSASCTCESRHCHLSTVPCFLFMFINPRSHWCHYISRWQSSLPASSFLYIVIRSLSYCACCSAAPAPGGRQQPRPRRTQRRVTHNEKRYHSGTPLSILSASCFCTILTSHRNIWKHLLLTFNKRTTWRRHQHANEWPALSSQSVFFMWFITASGNWYQRIELSQ